MQECTICHKPYIMKPYDMGDHITEFEEPQCDCEKREKERKEREELIQKRIDALHLPPKLLRFDLNTIECEHRAEARLFVEGFKPHRKGLFLWGPNGNGKTTLAAVMAKELAIRGWRVLFTSMTELLNRMDEGIGAARASNIKRILFELTRYHFIVFDDYGRENYTPNRLQNVFLIINTLYEWQVTYLMTANPECINRIANIPELAAIKDRMAEDLQDWEFTKPSFRRAMV